MAKVLTYNQKKHGFHGTDVYKLWSYIVGRCEDRKKSNYSYYGGSGVNVCKQWRENPARFCEWAIINGYKKGLEIDRINNEKGYSPDNCRFVTHKENCAPGKRRIFKNNKTGHTGISITKYGTFEVYVTKEGKQKYIGVRKTLDDAIKLKNNIIGNIHEEVSNG